MTVRIQEEASTLTSVLENTDNVKDPAIIYMALSREQFGKAGIPEQFAKSKVHSDKEFLSKIVSLAKLELGSTVLDVATGTGFVAVEFAQKTNGLVVGSDITREMIGWARKHAEKESVSDHTAFLLAEGSRQPFPNQAFNNVVSRLSLHHIADPGPVVKEMARLVKPGGRVIIADQISPEDEATAMFHDEFERFRDPSHQKALKLSKLKNLFKEAGLTIKGTKYSPVLLQLEDWAARSGCDKQRIEVLRRMMLGANPGFRRAFQIKESDGYTWFTLQRVILAGTR